MVSLLLGEERLQNEESRFSFVLTVGPKKLFDKHTYHQMDALPTHLEGAKRIL